MKVSINAVDIGYDDHGIGLPVIFLHAFPLNRSMWSGQMVSLLQEQRYRLVAPDLRGFGESVNVSLQVSMEIFADDLAALMDQLGMPQAVLCGLSMGGYAAFAFWRKYAQRVAGLILADTRPGADNAEGKARRESVARLIETQGTGALADLQMPNLLAEHTRTQHPEVERRVRQMIANNTPTGCAAASRGMAQRSDASDLLGQIRCPTLVLVGEQDVLTPPEEARSYAARIPGAQSAVIPQAGHLSNLEQPEAFLEVVRNFLLTEF